MRQNKQEYLLSWIFCICYLGIWIFLFWRCRYGFALEDETFYLTIPYRICMGDRFLIDEWHVSQMSAVFLLPLMKLYLSIMHSTEGIVLCFRYFFTVIWGISGIILWRKLNGFSLLGAMAASSCFALYAPWGIMALSYQSLSMLLLMISCLVLITDKRPVWMVCAGVLYAGSVLCSPYLVLLYPLSILSLLVTERSGRKELFRRWLFFSVGIFLSAAGLCLALLSAGCFSDYMKVFPMILNDPSHPLELNPAERVLFMIYHAQNINSYFKICVGVALSIIIAAKISGFHKIGLILLVIDIIFFLFSFQTGYNLLNFLMFPACFVGLYCFLCEDDFVIRKLFWGLWIPGFIYSFCHFYASNQNFWAYSHASAIMTIASLVIVVRYAGICCSESKYQISRISVNLAVGMLILCQLSCEMITRYQQVLWNEKIEDQTVLAEEGPEKGILINEDISEYYKLIEEDLWVLNEDSSIQKVLIVAQHPWLYLGMNKEYSTFTTWLEPMNKQSMERLNTYYEMFPDKIPDAVLFDRDYENLIPQFEKKGYLISDDVMSEYSRMMRRKIE